MRHVHRQLSVSLLPLLLAGSACLAASITAAEADPAPPQPSPPMPPLSPAGAPPLRPALNFTTVVTADDAIKSCYRNPVLIQTASGALLCFIEERSRGQSWQPGSGSHACPDNYGVGAAATGGHNLGYFRSTDLGQY